MKKSITVCMCAALVSVFTLSCSSPTESQVSVVPEGGKWTGTGISLNVADDGGSITRTGSTLSNGASIVARINLSSGGCYGATSVIRYIYTEISIKDGSFSYSDNSVTINGTFASPTTCGGTVVYRERDSGVDCYNGWFEGTLNFSATPQ